MKNPEYNEVDRVSTNLLDDIEQKAIFVLELLFIAILLGLIINFLSSVLFDRLWVNAPRSHHIVFLIIICIAIISILFLALYCTSYKSTQKFRIDILIPIKFTNEHVEIPYIRRYHPSRLAGNALSDVGWKNSKGETSFLEALRQPKTLTSHRELRGFSLDCVYDILEYLILNILGQYSRRTLGREAIYISEGSIPHGLEPVMKLEFDKIEGIPLTENYFFVHNDRAKQRIYAVPKGTTMGFSVLERKGCIAEDATKAIRELRLRSRYGKLTITPSQTWFKVPSNKQAGRILSKNVPSGPNTKVIGVMMELNIQLRFYPLWLLWPPMRNKFREQYKWLAGVSEHIARRLDWNRFLEKEKDRSLVRIEEKIDELFSLLSEVKRRETETNDKQ